MVFAKKRYLSARRSDPILAVFHTLFLRTLSVVRRCRIRNLALVVCLGWVSVAAAATGQDADAKGEASEAVTFAIPDAWPWAYEDKDGRPQGSLVELVNRLSERTGIPVEPRLRPVRRAIKELESGDVNFSILFQSPAQDKRAINVARVVEINIMLVALADTKYPLTLEALAGERIGYIRGTYLGEAFEHNTEVHKVPVALIGQAVEMLSLGRISAILASDHAIRRALHSMELQPDVLRYTRHIPGQSGALYMSGKAPRPESAGKFRKAIARIMESGELNRIFFGESGRPRHEGLAQSLAQ